MKTGRVEGKGQFVDYIEVLDIRGNKCRIRVVIGGYASQSYGVVERWSGVQWHEVATIKGDALVTDLKVGYKNAVGPADFRVDRERLVAFAKEVLEHDNLGE